MKKLLNVLFILTTLNSISQFTGQVDYQQYGISFTIPHNWIGQETEDIFVMSSSKEAGLLILMFHPEKNQEELLNKMNLGLQDGAVNLRPSGPLQMVGENQVEGMYSGMLDGQNVKGKVIALINAHGRGIAVFSLVNETRYTKRTNELAKLVASSVAFKKANPNVVLSSPYLEEAKAELVGYKLTYMESYYSNTPGGGGYERKRVLNLCSNGLFTFYGGSYLNFPDPNWDPMHQNAKGHGTYEILEDNGDIYLQLNYNDGEYESLKCTYDDGVYLNGGRYYRGEVDCF
ncbi:hypothetical protein [Croceivirga thetidis]|uniref:Uncharacterized protein n=1 Tax=Croceivirga thetidis TaxID=2721623 RepID=A0ABX1GUM3_9FLAO|nr:hypothetical protein [Croceivirga thetidis]NKI32695.1 hypothetical protein [Croceivirga thetidis]